jgi:hypothetical protein
MIFSAASIAFFASGQNSQKMALTLCGATFASVLNSAVNVDIALFLKPWQFPFVVSSLRYVTELVGEKIGGGQDVITSAGCDQVQQMPVHGSARAQVGRAS